jgi:hypothetical protein
MFAASGADLSAVTAMIDQNGRWMYRLHRILRNPPGGESNSFDNVSQRQPPHTDNAHKICVTHCRCP